MVLFHSCPELAALAIIKINNFRPVMVLLRRSAKDYISNVGTQLWCYL